MMPGIQAAGSTGRNLGLVPAECSHDRPETLTASLVGSTPVGGRIVSIAPDAGEAPGPVSSHGMASKMFYRSRSKVASSSCPWGTRPRSVWKARRAARVRGPMRPSTAPGSCPWRPCARRAAATRAASDPSDRGAHRSREASGTASPCGAGPRIKSGATMPACPQAKSRIRRAVPVRPRSVCLACCGRSAGIRRGRSGRDS